MKHIILLSLLFGVLHSYSQHTFSIVAVDTASGMVGSAGATCLDASSGIQEGAAIISGIIPGIGAINAQATVCVPNSNLNLGLGFMNNGLSPQEIIDTLLIADNCIFGNITQRQYGIADLDVSGAARSAGYTGANAMNYKGHLSGTNYSIQGNILLGPEILDSMEARFLRADGDLAFRLMEALQGANVAGADSRCLSEGVSSLSSFLKVAKPNDHPDSLYIEIIVNQTPFGSEPIDSLQKLFSAMMDTGTPTNLGGPNSIELLSVRYSLHSEILTVELPDTYQKNSMLLIYDLQGKLVSEFKIDETLRKASFPLKIQAGVYVYRLISGKQLLKTGKLMAH